MIKAYRKIVCLVENDRIPLKVEASTDMTVFELKELIVEERKYGLLKDIDSDDLVLWKLKVPVPVKPESSLAERVDFDDLPPFADRLESIDEISEIFPDPISVKDLRILVTLSLHLKHSLVPPITSRLLADRIDYEKRRSKAAPSSLGMPSTFLAQQTRSDGPAFYFDRPPPAAGVIPVTLLHPIFAQFMDDCKQHTPVEADTKLALEMSIAMSEIYASKEIRMSTFRDIMTENGLEMYARMVEGTQSFTEGDMRSEQFCYCIVEGKNEAGSRGSEPIFQAGACYVQMMADSDASTKHPHSRLPTLLIYLIGAHIGFVGAVFTNKPNLQVLVNPLALFSHHTDIEARTTAARYFGAVKKAIHSLRKYYRSFPSTIDSTDQPGFPYQRHYKLLTDGTTHNFTYETQLHDKLLFIGKADDGDRLCIKFVHTYSKEAHLACARLGFAPSLRGFEELPGKWYMVVMDEIDDSFRHFRKSFSTPALYNHMKQNIIKLHQAGFVHGDIRDVNFLVKEGNEHLMLVDFDWAGSIGEVRYPLFLNREDFWRPDDARDGSLILADHDISMLDAMFGKVLE